MRGIFIGKDSMGFKHGSVYDIRSNIKSLRTRGKDFLCICIYDLNSKAWCPYQSLEKVLENWELG